MCSHAEIIRFLPLIDAAFTWSNYKDSVEYIQGQTARLNWTVDVGDPLSVLATTIKRGPSDIIVIEKNALGIKKHLSSREADIDLVVQGTANVVNMTFILRNLAVSDEMNYEISVVSSTGSNDVKTTFLRVNGKKTNSILSQDHVYYPLLTFCYQFITFQFSG